MKTPKERFTIIIALAHLLNDARVRRNKILMEMYSFSIKRRCIERFENEVMKIKKPKQ
jgi:hypothetical protein